MHMQCIPVCDWRGGGELVISFLEQIDLLIASVPHARRSSK